MSTRIPCIPLHDRTVDVVSDPFRGFIVLPLTARCIECRAPLREAMFSPYASMFRCSCGRLYPLRYRYETPHSS